MKRILTGAVLCLVLGACSPSANGAGASVDLAKVYTAVYRVRSVICGIPLPAPGALASPAQGAANGVSSGN